VLSPITIVVILLYSGTNYNNLIISNLSMLIIYKLVLSEITSYNSLFPVYFSSCDFISHIFSCPFNCPYGVSASIFIPGYYKRNRYFQCCVEKKLL